ncbi:hypothetical protein F2P58_00150 [Vibrio fortis]|uniref:Uncharacterized protein n=1 Tax=Vibrio fortis TaxID=212667 RepID=A0A5N3RAY0_9VIBR|nr:hypothetical protein [Vibrio fortis]KAB0291608.1 hypothetical protein F2P58_00150 [Vibrio fortis]|tara:strand:+ start:747 stop:1421 length:675 start_codon:yes stop_codon:yes gene_type:complete
MPIREMSFAKPFFKATLVENEATLAIDNAAILLNLADSPFTVNTQALDFYESKIVQNITLTNIERVILIEGFDAYADEQALLSDIQQTWPLAYDVRKEERLKGIQFWMSPKEKVGNFAFSMYHAGSVPLTVGLHQTHVGFNHLREIHTQIVGFGKMQQCFEKDISTLYLEDTLAPGASHKPMYNQEGQYPWHQYETITPGVFMAIEMELEPTKEQQSQQDAISA